MIETNEISLATGKKKRGRPCALDRYKTELIQQKFTNILNNKSLNDEFTKTSILPFIVKRQRRQRANNRERSRMQTLNGALHVLKQHLPMDLYLQSKTNAQSQADELVQAETTKSKRANENLNNQAKMTKIDTLKFAAEYIKLLTSVLNDSNSSKDMNSNGFNSSFTSDSSTCSTVCSSTNCMDYKTVNYNYYYSYYNHHNYSNNFIYSSEYYNH